MEGNVFQSFNVFHASKGILSYKKIKFHAFRSYFVFYYLYYFKFSEPNSCYIENTIQIMNFCYLSVLKSVSENLLSEFSWKSSGDGLDFQQPQEPPPKIMLSSNICNF